MIEVFSVYTVTERNGNQYNEFPAGYGQESIKELRKEYPRYTKFVLEGFEINGTFKPVDLTTYNRIKRK
jgi:hypothetical protein